MDLILILLFGIYLNTMSKEQDKGCLMVIGFLVIFLLISSCSQN
jgi:hypothetical protein